MSHDFRLKFDEIKQNDPTSTENNNNSNTQEYSSPGHVRNIDFVWPDGKREFLNYAYLVNAKYDPEGSITLAFTSDTVVINGSGLNQLYDGILHQLTKSVFCLDPRYESLNADGLLVREIIITKNI
jgi:hypothetical protein